MRLLRPLIVLITCLWAAGVVLASPTEAAPLRHWNVDGMTREALVFAPSTAQSQPTPVLFVFHGHGGEIETIAPKWGFQKQWPEAIVVYPQGLNGPGLYSDPERR